MWQEQRRLNECEDLKVDLVDKSDTKKTKKTNEETMVQSLRTEQKKTIARGQEMEAQMAEKKEELDAKKEEMIRVRGNKKD